MILWAVEIKWIDKENIRHTNNTNWNINQDAAWKEAEDFLKSVESIGSWCTALCKFIEKETQN